jgi:hypothetical protein
MKGNNTSLLDDDSLDLMKAAFEAYLDKSYENPTEKDYIIVILGLFDNILRRAREGLPGTPGRPRKGFKEKEELYLAMSGKRRATNLGSDKAAQALFRENQFGRTNWKALKTSYYVYRRELIEIYQLDKQSLSKSEVDTQLRLLIAAARGNWAVMLRGG